MAKIDPLETGVSPTQVRIDYITVNRELLKGTFDVLFKFLPRCKRRGCKAIAMYEVQGGGKQVGMGMPRKALQVCGEHATDTEKRRAIVGADFLAVAAQLYKECE